MKKTLYFDIKTEARMNKGVNKLKKRDKKMSQSKLIRLWVASPIFDTSIEELNTQLEV